MKGNITPEGSGEEGLLPLLQLAWREGRTPSHTRLGPWPTNPWCASPGGAGPAGPVPPPSRIFRTFLGLTRNFPEPSRTFQYMNLGVFLYSESIRDTPEIIQDSDLSSNHNCTYLSLLPKASYCLKCVTLRVR